MEKTLVSVGLAVLVLAGLTYVNVSKAASTYRAALPIVRAVKNDHPPGCLSSWPKVSQLTGRLAGTIFPAYPKENPPVPSRVFLFLLLQDPISVCAFSNGRAKVPAYVNVTQIGLGWWSVADFQLIRKKWYRDQIRITGTLWNAGLTGGAPGLVILSVQTFCSRKIGSEGAFQCQNWNAWLDEIR